MLNHLTNGNPGFTAGPPISDVVMKGESVMGKASAVPHDAIINQLDLLVVKRVTAYYQSGKDKPSGCTKEAACMI
jgi:hypothetical protein